MPHIVTSRRLLAHLSNNKRFNLTLTASAVGVIFCFYFLLVRYQDSRSPRYREAHRLPSVTALRFTPYRTHRPMGLSNRHPLAIFSFCVYTITMGKKPATCGTLSGYAKHLRLKEVTCQPCRDANYQRSKKYYRKNKAKVYAINRAWAKRNPEKVKEIQRINNKKVVRKRNGPKVRSDITKEKDVARTRKRRAIKASTQTEFYTWQNVIEIYGTKCFLCHTEIDLTAPRSTSQKGWEQGLHLDHWVPLSKGGSDLLENIRPVHGLCNIKKQNKISE